MSVFSFGDTDTDTDTRFVLRPSFSLVASKAFVPRGAFWNLEAFQKPFFGGGGFGFGGVTLDEMSEPMKQPKQDTLRGFGIWGNGDVGSHRICISFLLPIQDNRTLRQTRKWELWVWQKLN